MPFFDVDHRAAEEAFPDRLADHPGVFSGGIVIAGFIVLGGDRGPGRRVRRVGDEP